MHEKSKFGIGDCIREREGAVFKVIRSENSEHIVRISKLNEVGFIVDGVGAVLCDDDFVHILINICKC